MRKIEGHHTIILFFCSMNFAQLIQWEYWWSLPPAFGLSVWVFSAFFACLFACAITGRLLLRTTSHKFLKKEIRPYVLPFQLFALAGFFLIWSRIEALPYISYRLFSFIWFGFVLFFVYKSVRTMIAGYNRRQMNAQRFAD